MSARARPERGHADFLAGGGGLGALMRERDWSGTPLGDPSGWPQSLRSALGICLASRFPIAIYWGEALALLYNDAWSPIPGTKHPWALGRPAREVWPEIWDAIGPLFEQVMSRGESTYAEDSLLLMHRHGYTEECYFNFTFTPIRGADGRVEGVFNAVVETTFRFVSERRTRVLRDLSERLAAARSREEAFVLAARSLDSARDDFPFCALYALDEGATEAFLAGISGVARGDPRVPERVALTSGGEWLQPVHGAFVAPISAGTTLGAAGFLVAGLNPRRAMDEEYRQFIERIAAQIGKVASAAAALEAERKRAEILADLDRAKTAFFSNVSHEFRTPLTLMLGPVEDLLGSEGALSGENRAVLATVQRNGQRLLKLVNALLDFARIEAGRAQASFEPVDLGALTADLASSFRAACERAGLDLNVECPSPPEPAYVDREMWEKIVLNLLSNAFKFTLKGAITVSVEQTDDRFVLAVRDTGRGIPANELPRTFERFHRVEGASGRSHEGSGIGLALVQELVKLHGGSISVDSAVGKGATFSVAIPKGRAHLLSEHLKAQGGAAISSARAGAFVDEALGWLPRPASEAQNAPAGAPRVLLADDNADLRDYARRLLSEQYHIETVADGEAALAAARARRPDLVISDVMMPKLDGFGLIRELRADENLRDLPVILLSARAGEEARMEGLGKGADDYLVKPFSARELLVRAGSLLHSARVRRDALEQQQSEARALARLAELSSRLWSLNNLAEGLDEMIAGAIELLGADMGNIQILDAERGVLTIAAQRGFKPDFLEFFREVSTEDDSACGRTLRAGVRIVIEDVETDPPYAPLRAVARAAGYRGVQSTPLIGRDGTPLGMLSTHWALPHLPSDQDLRRLDLYARRAADFIERLDTDNALRESEARFRALTAMSSDWYWEQDEHFRYVYVSDDVEVRAGVPKAFHIGKTRWELPHAGVSEEQWAEHRALLERHEPYRDFEFQRITERGDTIWASASGAPVFDAEGRFKGYRGTGTNITERKRQENLQAFLLTLSDALRPLADPHEIQALAADLLGEHLQVNQVNYGEVRGEYVHISHSYANGLAPMVGTFHPDDFGKRLIDGHRAGRLQVCLNTTSDPLFDEQERKALAAAHVGAYIAVPLLKDGVWVGVLSVLNIQPRDWAPTEVEAVQEVAERTWAAVERTRAERALSKSEEKYRTLFDSIDEGVAIVEVLFDDEDRAVDYVILETNQAHEKMSGMPRTFVGKRVREVMPNIEESVIERVARVALTGEPIRFEEYVSALGRWFDIYLSRVGGEGSRTVVSLANNITERKRREQHAAFLDTLSQALTLLESPKEIVRATGEALGAYLDVSFVHVVDVELDPGDEPAEARITVLATWEREGFLVASGTYRAGDYLSEEFLRAARAGEPIVTPDADTDPRVNTEAYRAIGVRAVVAVPILKDDAWPGLIAVGTPGVRDWRPDEVTLIVEVARRIFPLFERVRAVEALRQSEVRLRESAVRTRSLQRRLMESEENERRAIHRELHDRIGQDLASAKLNIDLARSKTMDSAATGARLEAARDLVQNAIDNSRNIMGELRPPGLDEHGLAVALGIYTENVAKRFSIDVTVDGIELEQRLPRLVETALFRITQEAISNLARHASARKVDISLQEEGQEVRLTITDDGTGFDINRLPEAGRYGFQIMRERAEAVDARLEIESTPGRGTRVIARLVRTA